MGEYRNTAMDNLLGAVADSTRRAILARLATGDARVTEVAAEFPISLNSVSKHVRMLERAGLVRRTVRGRDHVLSLDAAPLAEAAAWIAHYRRFWEDRLEALDKFVTNKRKTPRKRKSK
jgi:DNA-binding transcriptional ArsR family regulator